MLIVYGANMWKKIIVSLLVSASIAVPVFADEHEHGDIVKAQALIKEMMVGDKHYISAHKPEFFQALAKGQHPRATVVTCSDSRVHIGMLEKTPEGDLFVVRNIGNQLATSKGSVQYGVNHLASSLLIFIGHSSCGAIKAAGGDYSTLEDGIKKELDTISITKGGVSIDGVKTNVNNQVTAALQEFAGKVSAGHLLIVGAVYDFSDDMKQGAGKLNIINVNGDTDAAKIKTALTVKAPSKGAEKH
jgi:carbonic anhydrase